MRKGFTVIETFVVLCILSVIAALLLPAIMHAINGKYVPPTIQANYKCIKTYVVKETKYQDSMRVDLRPQSGEVVTMVCEDSWDIKRDAAARYAQFEAGHWYQVKSIGERREGYSPSFPNVFEVVEITDPTK